MATWPDMVRIMCGYTRYRRRCTINLTKTVNIELKLLTAIACLLDVVRRERRWRCASWSMTGDGIGDDSLIQNRMHRLCHKCGSEDQLQERLWPCVDELNERLPPGRSWCRRPPSPHHTPPATLLYRPPVSLAEQEELSTSSMLPSVDQRSASSGLQQLAVPAATLSIEYSAGVGLTASGWRGRPISAGAAWLNVPCSGHWPFVVSQHVGLCSTRENQGFSAQTYKTNRTPYRESKFKLLALFRILKVHHRLQYTTLFLISLT